MTREGALIPDDGALPRDELILMADELRLNLIITTGGTGMGPRDILDVIDGSASECAGKILK